MPNMKHCRFTNTLQDLRDCYGHMFDEDLSKAEAKARDELLLLCDLIAAEYGCEIDDIRENRQAQTKG